MNSNDSLINKMSVENINILLADVQRYPITTQSCIDDIKNNISWMDLKYDTICILNDVFRMGYNPTNVASLFTNK
jgi:hypothetical protein